LNTLREPVPPYGDHFDRENEALRPDNTVPWKTNLETTDWGGIGELGRDWGQIFIIDILPGLG